MQAFSQLLDNLYFTASTKTKATLIQEYLKTTPDPDRGWALAAIAGTLSFDFFKRSTVKQLMLQHIDPILFELSYDYVGEMSETVAHLWPNNLSGIQHEPQDHTKTSLSCIIESFKQAKKQQVPQLLAEYLSGMTPSLRWALLKLGTRGLRVGVSARALKKCLADYGHVDVQELETVWHALEPPYTDLLAWLEGKGDKPDTGNALTYFPVMLAQPLDESKLASFSPEQWLTEWKFDGIRVQFYGNQEGKALYSRTGDDISHSFPDLLDTLNVTGRLDGELLAIDEQGNIASFNQLQQRLNKKRPTKKLMDSIPVIFMAYDAIELNGKALHSLSLIKRRQILEEWYASLPSQTTLRLSTLLPIRTHDDWIAHRNKASDNLLIEGLMLKRKNSHYQSGRPANQWLKWKRDPLVVDAVVMYAQRGHGKRSSYFSDFTFGAWHGDTLLPIGKAYSGFTDEELKRLDNWVRKNTMGRFGPVKEVKKSLVFEIAFDAVHPSKRHKSGIALRFPRINRIRWDKPAQEADTVDSVKTLIRS
jgi:DNA ligase-1